MITEMEKIDFILKEGAKNGMPLTEFIKAQIDEFKQSEQYKEMLIGGRYYKNDGDIKEKQRTYIDEYDGTERVSPHAKNYQLKHPIIYKMINQKAGYLVREKPTIKQIIDKNQKENEEYKKVMKKIFNTKMHKRLKYTLIEAVKRGMTWWQLYIDENGDFKVRLRYATRIVPLWKDEEHEEIDGLIMFYDVQVYNDANNKEIKTKVEYYDEEGVRYYIYDANNLIQDVEEVEKRKELVIGEDTEKTSILGHFSVNGKVKLWEKGIPFIYYKYNADELPLIHFLKSLLDCYDELNSKIGDAIYESPEGVNVIKGYNERAGEFQKNLQTFNTVVLEDGGAYERVKIEINIEAFKSFIEQLRKDIYEGGSGVDTQSEKFGTQESGVALKQLYADLDLDCSNIETEFQSSFQHFKGFVDEWQSIKENKDYSELELEWIFNKTMTVNEKELIENCNNSLEVLSRKTALAHHPYVTSVEDEMQKIEDEEKEQEKKNESEYAKALKQLRNNKNSPQEGDNDE